MNAAGRCPARAKAASPPSPAGVELPSAPEDAPGAPRPSAEFAGTPARSAAPGLLSAPPLRGSPAPSGRTSARSAGAPSLARRSISAPGLGLVSGSARDPLFGASSGRPASLSSDLGAAAATPRSPGVSRTVPASGAPDPAAFPSDWKAIPTSTVVPRGDPAQAPAPSSSSAGRELQATSTTATAACSPRDPLKAKLARALWPPATSSIPRRTPLPRGGSRSTGKACHGPRNFAKPPPPRAIPRGQNHLET